MSDIVERLRRYAVPEGFHVPICGEAAAEIERLRAALQDIAGIHNLTISDAGKWMRAYGMARRALEGK